MRHRFMFAASALLLWAAPALAQDASSLPSPEELNRGDAFSVGLGVGLVPDYEGSNDYRLVPGGAVRGRVGGVSFTTRGLYLYVDAVPAGSGVDFDAGPIVGVRLNRSGKIKDDIVDRLPERKAAIEAGAFVGISAHGLTNPYDSLAFRVDAVHDVGNGHESTVVTPNLEFSTPLSRTLFVGASVSADFVSNRFADYYFGISLADSLASGLAPFNPDGGVKNWKLGLLANQSLTGDLLHGMSIFGLGSYSRLVGDFKHSPIVSDRGSASQWFGGLGLAYSW
jgi:outer membrane scaffolding protein for murein synthesis (MipA/OmpV family)